MSYILDALRRAEAERERGAVPGVHTEQFPSMPDADEVPRRPVALIATVAVLALALAGVVGWLAFGGREAPVAIVARGTVAPAVVAPTAVVPTAVVPPPTVQPAPAPAASMATAVPTAAPTPTPKAASIPAASAPARTPVAPVAKPERAERAEPAASANDRVYTVAELPAAAKSAMPTLAFNGSSWSSAASSRMVIWNGRVFHEGDTVAPGVVLKRIERKSAQLAVKGYRVDVPF